MAIGDMNNNGNQGNNNNRGFDNTYFSRIRVKNNNLSLSVSFRSGLLVFEISELQEGNGFKYDPIESIYLSPTKARILTDQINTFKKYLNSGDIIEGKAFGVNAGMGEKVSYIGFHANADRDIFITIGKIDGSGNILNKGTITLNKEYHYGLEWNNIDQMDLYKNYVDDLELNQIHDLVNDFARAMSGAYGYAALDLGRYDQRRILNKMDPIYDKLGIERMSGKGNNRNNDFLAHTEAKTTSNHTTIDNLMGD